MYCTVLVYKGTEKNASKAFNATQKPPMQSSHWQLMHTRTTTAQPQGITVTLNYNIYLNLPPSTLGLFSRWCSRPFRMRHAVWCLLIISDCSF